MERVPLDENAAARQRLTSLIDALSEDGLRKPVTPGWDVATVLAELAFWDRWAQTLVRRWRSGHIPPPTVPDWYDDAINVTLLPTWRALPGPVAAQLAIAAAEETDLEIRKAETPVVAGIFAAGQHNLLNRYIPRNTAIDRIEAAI
ncbi:MULTISPECIES: maleylpyruvate isomerase N-terminal domain-containing protein [Dactylosporangium]|uniref:Maleylpyruvate isomerase N-terminal domain-containing protein n=1 Tax=Dactylosporangium vinaceum TaxID=53362 RepID=A0ABV5MFP6_9ACTN|nr:MULTISPECIES: maleylpyruvate isomerase N-terminal domain-containing protein [Dactylosporangium]UAB98826.1 maleylpyruvate isomerase N-terminal domain-containing protein [Dactylosporangium vinaceum]UWZ47076.1 maleylpyruvate isomerase N-terminal domain-containing protein [Dactylosporangium matsuzakiense]